MLLETPRHVLCTQIRRGHRGDQHPRDEHLHSAMDALDIMLPGLDVGEMEPDDISQNGHEISLVPFTTLDTRIPPGEFVDTVSAAWKSTSWAVVGPAFPRLLWVLGSLSFLLL